MIYRGDVREETKHLGKSGDKRNENTCPQLRYGMHIKEQAGRYIEL